MTSAAHCFLLTHHITQEMHVDQTEDVVSMDEDTRELLREVYMPPPIVMHALMDEQEEEGERHSTPQSHPATLLEDAPSPATWLWAESERENGSNAATSSWENTCARTLADQQVVTFNSLVASLET